MSKNQEREGVEHQKQLASESRNARIGQRVMHILGQPDHLRAVQVRLLWEDHYRVNVFVGTDAVTTTISNSYFVQADADGNIIASNPKITAPI